MPIPEVTESVSDGALGLLPEATDAIFMFTGYSSAGTANTFYSFTDLASVQTTLGYGPLPEAIATALNVGGGTAYAMKVAADVNGSNTAVTQTGGGPVVTLTDTAVLVPTGPFDAYQGIVEILVGGAVGTATFRLSLDGGDSYGPATLTAATVAIANTNITLNFAAGTYVVATTYTWTSTPPGYSTGVLNTTIDNILADSREWSILHVVGSVGGATDALKAAAYVALATAVSTKLATAFTQHRFVRAVLDSPDITNNAAGDTEFITAFVAFADPRIVASAGFCELVSPMSLRTYKRPASWPAVARAKLVPISEDLAFVGRGALASVLSIYRDEFKRPGLDAARFLTLRTLINFTGFLITNPKTMASTTSDFQLLQHGRIIDSACKTARIKMLPRLSSKTRYYGTPPPSGKVAGSILEQDARVIEADVVSGLNATLTQNGHVQFASAEINRTDNIVSTQKIRAKVRVRPFAYPKFIEVEIGFEPLQ